MCKLTCYIDGSQVKVGNMIRQGWGILASHYGKETIELNGCVQHNQNDKHMSGWHEMLAFYAAIDHAEAHGLVPSEVSFYTDCDWIAYSGFHLVPQNHSGSKRAIVKRLRTFQKRFYPTDKFLVMRMVRWMIGAQMHWVKGHSGDVNNNRVDYLARAATKGTRANSCMEFTKWISNGFAKWCHKENRNILYSPPFAPSVHK